MTKTKTAAYVFTGLAVLFAVLALIENGNHAGGLAALESVGRWVLFAFLSIVSSAAAGVCILIRFFKSIQK